MIKISPYQNFTSLPEAWAKRLKLKKMHRAKKIEPKEILTPHIEFNNEKRKNTRNDFEKDMFKILNNALKFMVVIDNLRNVRAKQEDSTTKKVNKIFETNEVIQRSFNSIRSKIHKIYSINTKQVSLNSYENKDTGQLHQIV